MKAISSFIAVVLLTAPLAGCIVRSRPNHHHHNSSARRSDCPPSTHWNGYKCEHNGRGRGNKHR